MSDSVDNTPSIALILSVTYWRGVLPILEHKQMSFGKTILTHAYLPEIYLSTKPSFMFGC